MRCARSGSSPGRNVLLLIVAVGVLAITAAAHAGGDDGLPSLLAGGRSVAFSSTKLPGTSQCVGLRVTSRRDFVVTLKVIAGAASAKGPGADVEIWKGFPSVCTDLDAANTNGLADARWVTENHTAQYSTITSASGAEAWAVGSGLTPGIYALVFAASTGWRGTVAIHAITPLTKLPGVLTTRGYTVDCGSDNTTTGMRYTFGKTFAMTLAGDTQHPGLPYAFKNGVLKWGSSKQATWYLWTVSGASNVIVGSDGRSKRYSSCAWTPA